MTSSRHTNDGLSKYGGRDVMGWGSKSPSPRWPHGAKVAISICIHYESGSEPCLLHGDDELMRGERFMVAESFYDYGGRTGFWRLHRLFTKRKIPVTVFAVGMSLERNPAICNALKSEKDWEIASGGYRCINYQTIDESTQRDHMDRAVSIQDRIFEKRPVGYFQSEPNVDTRPLVMQEGGFSYESNSYAEDLPYWITDPAGERPHLVIPHSLTENDSKFFDLNGFANGVQFRDHLIRTFNAYLEEGRNGTPKLMTISLHCWLARPGFVSGFAEFLDYIQRNHSKYDVWFATREQLCNFWMEHHFPVGGGAIMKPK